VARGKYAARATNRLADLDNDVIAELKESLAACSAERDTLRRELNRLTAQMQGEAQRVGAQLAADRVAEAERQLAEQRRAHEEDKARMARELFEILRSENVSARGTTTWYKIAAIFGQQEEFGSLITGGNPTRNQRRTTPGKVKMLAEIERSNRRGRAS
jgi:DeoR/GlpR family transcriptional regulator of sugar metabolism